MPSIAACAPQLLWQPDARLTVIQPNAEKLCSASCCGNLFPSFPFIFTTSKGEGHEQHRLVGWRRRYRHRRSESRWICLIY
jgi:hypothetical protein